MENWLNEGLDWDHIKKTLTDDQHILVRNIFKQDFAEKIFDCLKADVQWQMSYREGDKDVVVHQAELKTWSDQKIAVFHAALTNQAREGYQFFYNRYPMIDSHIDGQDPGLFLHQVTEFLNGEDFIKFAHYITGDLDIRKSEPQATLYSPGNFLKAHDDFSSPELDRRYAMVFNFTKDWESHWGGLLQILGEEGIKETVMPTFNSVSILKLPQVHQVSYVAPFAMKPRFAITSWLRAD